MNESSDSQLIQRTGYFPQIGVKTMIDTTALQPLGCRKD
jgi:hypothetical protein